MIDIYNDIDTIKFRRDFSYDEMVPTFINNPLGSHDEVARWVLDLNDIVYKDEPHAPYLLSARVSHITENKSAGNSPVLIASDCCIYTANSLLQYNDQHCLSSKKLVPDEPEKRKEVLSLYNKFTNQLEDNVTKYVYCQLLPHPQITKKLFTKGVPFKERLAYSLNYPAISNALTKELRLADKTTDERLAFIRQTFDEVNTLLSDGRKYLTGDTFTIADIAFAAVAAPLILPEEFGGVVARIEQLPDEMRNVVVELRKTAAGQFVLDRYQENRPSKSLPHTLPKTSMISMIADKLNLSKAGSLSGLFFFLQKRYPVLKISPLKLMTVNRNDLVNELLDRDLDFTVEEINSKKMADQKGAFFLGWDRDNPQFDKERNFVRSATKKDDLETIRTFIRKTAQDIIDGAQDYGKLDVASTLNYPVLVRLLDFYFGIPSPSENKMKLWCRYLFYDLFLNFTNNADKHRKAVEAANERKEWIVQIIRDRKEALKDGKSLYDNLLSRMITMQGKPGYEWVDEDVLQRNIGGLLTGILETTNKAIVWVLDELFNRPETLKGAIETAKGGDMTKMYGYVSEALRFNPVQPGVIRYSEAKQTIKGKGDTTYVIPAKTKVFALTAAAMFDPVAFPAPKEFNPDRKATYMNYGYGLHECFGKYINSVTITELVAAVLRLKNVRREPGRAGRGLKQGPFPTNFVVAFGQGDDSE